MQIKISIPIGTGHDLARDAADRIRSLIAEEGEAVTTHHNAGTYWVTLRCDAGSAINRIQELIDDWRDTAADALAALEGDK